LSAFELFTNEVGVKRQCHKNFDYKVFSAMTQFSLVFVITYFYITDTVTVIFWSEKFAEIFTT
jgi:hypothetical protein